MSLVRIAGLCAILVCAVGGCRTGSSSVWTAATAQPPAITRPVATETTVPRPQAAQFTTVAYQSPPVEEVAEPGAEPGMPFHGQTELNLPELIREVEARNPSLQAMWAAWQAAAQRYPQVVSLDDPMLMTMLGPASLGSNKVDPAYNVELSQKLPWFGERAARGEMANAETDASLQRLRETRLQLVEAVQRAYFQYFMVWRQLQLNLENQQVMRQFRDTARIKYEANQVTNQDVLQADVELVELERRRLELQRQLGISVARINTLIHVPPHLSLPAPASQLPVPWPVERGEVLQQIATAQRPELAEARANLAEAEAGVRLAETEYYPDVEVSGGYNMFMQMGAVAPDVGVRMNVPVRRARLNAALREAKDRVAQQQAAYQQKQLDVQYEVESARVRLEESRQTVALFSDKLIPIAKHNVAAARANYEAAKGSFLDLATAERQWIDISDRHAEALAAYYIARAELERAVGGFLPGPPSR